MSKKSKRLRLDFIQEIISKKEDEGAVTYRVTLIPNPERYEWKEIAGKKYLFDKLDQILLSEEVFRDLAKQMKALPIYFQKSQIDDTEQYIKSMEPSILARLTGNDKLTSLEDKSEAFLESLAKDKLGFVIMCVDIAGSTKLSLNLRPEKYARLISTTLYEVSEIIPLFHGHVLKYTGDGLIAYFAEPSFILKNDLALYCALTIRKLVYVGLNKVLEENGYPRIDIRIGLDSGDAYIVTIGSPKTKRHKDVIGSVVSLAAKIQGLGDPGDILLGEVTVRNLHTKWRQICEDSRPPEEWKYKDENGKPYQVYKVKLGRAQS